MKLATLDTLLIDEPMHESNSHMSLLRRVHRR
jgi:hypothetical protein